MPATTAVPVSATPTRNASAEHRFYTGSAIVALAIAMVAFLPGIFDPASRRGPLTLWSPFMLPHSLVGWFSTSFRLFSSVPATTLERPRHAVPGVVEHDIDITLGKGRARGFGDLLWIRDVEREQDEVGKCRELSFLRRISHGADDRPAPRCEQFRSGSAESGGATGNEDGSGLLARHSVIPPSTGITAAAATSSDLAIRPIGVRFS